MSSDSDYSDSDSGSESGSYSDTGSESDSGSNSDYGNCAGGRCGIKSKNSCPGGQCGIKSKVSKVLKAPNVKTKKKTKARSRQSYSSCSGSDCGSSGSCGSDSECEGFECCSGKGQCGRGEKTGKNKKKGRGNTCDLMGMMDGSLPFDPASIENIILSLSDKFNFRVVMNNEKVKKAAMITTGLSIAGTLIGKHYGGKMGAAVGGAVGGMCGVGLCVVAMRDVWDDIKYRLAQIFDLVYDYLVGMGVKDYRTALKYLTNTNSDADLAKIVLDVASSTLGKQIMSSLTG